MDTQKNQKTLSEDFINTMLAKRGFTNRSGKSILKKKLLNREFKPDSATMLLYNELVLLLNQEKSTVIDVNKTVYRNIPDDGQDGYYISEYSKTEDAVYNHISKNPLTTYLTDEEVDMLYETTDEEESTVNDVNKTVYRSIPLPDRALEPEPENIPEKSTVNDVNKTVYRNIPRDISKIGNLRRGQIGKIDEKHMKEIVDSKVKQMKYAKLWRRYLEKFTEKQIIGKLEEDYKNASKDIVKVNRMFKIHKSEQAIYLNYDEEKGKFLEQAYTLEEGCVRKAGEVEVEVDDNGVSFLYLYRHDKTVMVLNKKNVFRMCPT